MHDQECKEKKRFNLNSWARFVPIYAVLIGFLVAGLIWGGSQTEKVQKLEDEVKANAQMRTDIAVIQVELKGINAKLDRLEQDQKILDRLNQIEARLPKR